MITNAFVETSNIKGDISSCGTTATIINCAERPNLFLCTDIHYATNNCTGKTDIYHSWSISGTTTFFYLCFFVFLVAVIFKFFFD